MPPNDNTAQATASKRLLEGSLEKNLGKACYGDSGSTEGKDQAPLLTYEIFWSSKNYETQGIM